jgi:hypothetical protein
MSAQLPLSRKRSRDREESSNDRRHRNESEPGDKTVTGSTESVVDLELVDDVEVPPHRKRRGVIRSERSAKNNSAGECVQIPKGVSGTKKEDGSEHAQVTDHSESHEGIAAIASHPMDSDSEETSRDDGSTNTHSQKLSTSRPPLNASRRQCAGVTGMTQLGEKNDAAGKHRTSPSWEDRLSELSVYRKIYGHCNVPKSYNENTKLTNWVVIQGSNYKLYREGKTSPMTPSRIKELESMDFEWDSRGAFWEARLRELGDYRKIHGHCNVPQRYSENTKLAHWVGKQRTDYRLQQEGKTSPMTLSRIKELEDMGFE